MKVTNLILMTVVLSTMISCNVIGGGSDFTSFTSGGGLNDLTNFGTGSDGNITFSGGTYFTTNTMPGSTRDFGGNKRIDNIDAAGTTLTTSGAAITAAEFSQGDEIMWIVVAADGNTICASDGSLPQGSYGFSTITNNPVGGTTLVLSSSITTNAVNLNLANGGSLGPGDVNFCTLVVYRVPNFNNLTVTANQTIDPSSLSHVAGGGGVIVMRVKETLSVSSGTLTINNTGRGNQPHNGSGDDNIQGRGYSGLGIATCSTTGCGTEIANDNGGGRGLDLGSQLAAGGGGGNTGVGGRGSSSSGNVDYGRAGNTAFCSISSCLFMGGSGGSGATAAANNAAAGGGVILIWAKNISGNVTLNAAGNSATGQTTNSGGGGGAGGSIVAEIRSISSGLLTLNSSGGSGANSTGNYGGGGGGGGSASLKYCFNSGAISVLASGGSLGTSGGGTPDFGSSGGAGVATTDENSSHSFCP